MNAIIVGAGGHARVVYDILRHDHNVTVVSFVDNSPRGSDERIMGVSVTGDHDAIPAVVDDHDVGGFIVAVGDNEIRSDHFRTLTEMGLEPVSAIHPNAHVSETAEVGAGSVVASGVNVSTNVTIGRNAIVNTGAVVDHESEIGAHAHVGPGTSVAGRVTVGEGSFVGMGSAVKEYTDIGARATVGAGSVVLEDVEEGATVAGTPAEVKKRESDDG